MVSWPVVLRDIAHCLGEGFGTDESLIVRFGGDEFAAVRPGRQIDSVGLLQAADRQLYEIKRVGRNGVATAWVDSA